MTEQAHHIPAMDRVKRRDFILLSAAIGIGVAVAPFAVPRLLQLLNIDNDAVKESALYRKVVELINRLEAKQITAEHFAEELGKYYQEIDINRDIYEGMIELADGRPRVKLITRSADDRLWRLQLWWVAPNSCQPPHAHHNLVSTQVVLKGKAHVRQYERIQRIDDRTLAVRQTSDRILAPYEYFKTTEYTDNAHWFGADSEPATILNLNAKGYLDNTFELADGRKLGRYYIDPTLERRSDGSILASETDKETAWNKFSNRPLRDFETAS